MPCAPFRDGRPRPILAPRREGVHAGNLIGYENGAVIAFAEVHGPAETAPFREPSAVPVEKLHAIVFVIADDQPVLAIDDNGMRRHELARILAEFAEARAPVAFRIKTMDPRIAVTIGNVDLSVKGDGGSRWMVERSHPSRNVPFADPQQHFALMVEDDNLMRVAIGDPDSIPAVNRNAVRIEYLALPGAANERAVRVEDEHRRLPAP